MWLSHEPWIVPEPFTPEAGELWSQEDIDEWIGVLRHVCTEAYEQPDLVRSAPHRQVVTQLDPSALDDPVGWRAPLGGRTGARGRRSARPTRESVDMAEELAHSPPPPERMARVGAGQHRPRLVSRLRPGALVGVAIRHRRADARGRTRSGRAAPARPAPYGAASRASRSHRGPDHHQRRPERSGGRRHLGAGIRSSKTSRPNASSAPNSTGSSRTARCWPAQVR